MKLQYKNHVQKTIHVYAVAKAESVYCLLSGETMPFRQDKKECFNI